MITHSKIDKKAGRESGVAVKEVAGKAPSVLTAGIGKYPI